jgi:hypothetical protein
VIDLTAPATAERRLIREIQKARPRCSTDSAKSFPLICFGQVRTRLFESRNSTCEVSSVTVHSFSLVMLER